MGLLDEFDIDMSGVEAPESGYASLPDDIYEYTVGDVYLKEGSKKNPEQNFIVFKYLLGEDGKEYSEFFGLPLDVQRPSDNELKKLGFYKSRLLSLGVSPDAVNDVEASDLVGITGTFELRTTRSKNNGQEYQNIRNFKVSNATAPANSSVAKAPVKKAATAVDNPFA